MSSEHNLTQGGNQIEGTFHNSGVQLHGNNINVRGNFILNAGNLEDNNRQSSSAPPQKPVWNLPFQKNTRFVGRNAEIEQIDAALSTEARCERVAIAGLGGVGKTQIALECAHRWKEKHPKGAVLWIPVTSFQRMMEAYVEIGRLLDISSAGNPEDTQRLVLDRLNHRDFGDWLLIFDNADNINDIDTWMNRTDPTRQLDNLPKSLRGSILFTTRSGKIAKKLAPKHRIKVNEMDDNMAKAPARSNRAEKRPRGVFPCGLSVFN